MREILVVEYIVDYTVIYAMESRHFVFWFQPLDVYRGL